MMRVPKISTSILDMAILGVLTMGVLTMGASIVRDVSIGVPIMGTSTMSMPMVSYITESCPIWVRAITRSFGESRANESHTRRSLNETGG